MKKKIDQIEISFSNENEKNSKAIKLKDLKKINNLKSVFKDIRDYFAGNVTGISRDETIAKNIMRLLFCKIYDEKTNKDLADFSNKPNESIIVFEKRINLLFKSVKEKYPDIFEKNEKIEIRGKELSYIVSKLERFSIVNADRDVIADAFEELIGISFRGGEGQFFTPKNIVELMVQVLNPKDGEKIIDPACGSGGFLIESLKYLNKNNSKDFIITGIDKDAFLAKIAKTYLTLVGDNNYDIFCENSLENTGKWSKRTSKTIQPGSFDVILTNPPFGAKIPVIGNKLLGSYNLGHKWKLDDGVWIKTSKIVDKRPPQILFIERCIELLKIGGRMGIVLPEGVFGNHSERYIWEYIHSVASVKGVVSLAQETFQPSTHTKTSILFLEKTKSKSKHIFMSIAKNVGHDKNGKPIFLEETGEINDDTLEITKRFKNFNKKNRDIGSKDSLGFSIKSNSIKNNIFVPEYYNPNIPNKLKDLEASGNYSIYSIGELIDKNILSIKRGNEIGSKHYGTGDIPFVRTSDIVNWEIKFDPIKCVSNTVFEKYKKRQDIDIDDILFVGDGTFLIGRTAMITKYDLKIVIQSHVKRIRVVNRDFISPFYLFYLFNTAIFKEQVKSKTFVQATISTIGNRLNEILLPISKDSDEINKIENEVKSIIEAKANLKNKVFKLFK